MGARRVISRSLPALDRQSSEKYANYVVVGLDTSTTVFCGAVGDAGDCGLEQRREQDVQHATQKEEGKETVKGAKERGGCRDLAVLV